MYKFIYTNNCVNDILINYYIHLTRSRGTYSLHIWNAFITEAVACSRRYSIKRIVGARNPAISPRNACYQLTYAGQMKMAPGGIYKKPYDSHVGNVLLYISSIVWSKRGNQSYIIHMINGKQIFMLECVFFFLCCIIFV